MNKLLQNTNFRNNQNYILGKAEKIKTLKDILENKNETIIPIFQGSGILLIFLLLYLKSDFFEKVLENAEGISFIIIFYFTIIGGLILIGIITYFNEYIRLNNIIKKGKVKIYKKKIPKIKLIYDKKYNSN